MKKLLSGINSMVGKVAFQNLTIKHGFESIEVLVPLKNVEAFELDLQNKSTKADIFEVLSVHGGELKK